ncbi:MAG: methylated-DNA--[protein]-cysteine S-methyltransferase [Microthrixaceae bacterium]
MSAQTGRWVDTVDADEMAALRERLASAAADEGLLDVAYRVVDSPHGRLLLAASDAGVVRVAFAVEDHDRVLDQLASDISARVLRTPARTEDAARQIDEYFDGHRRGFDLALDLRLLSGFRRLVVERLGEIPFGATETYAQVATRVDNPAAVRAVGSACSHNPVPIVLPCHRVVRSDGSVGQYLGGTDVKTALLKMESQRSTSRHRGER